MKSLKLTECTEPHLYRGTVLRFIGTYPFDKEYVDFMICEYYSAKEDRCPLAVYCVSGYHAGCQEYVFPKEAQAEGAIAIRTDWLKENWQKMVCGGCTADKVTVILK